MKKTKKEQSESACRLGKVGGEAVIEGIMMKAGDRLSTACRNEEGKIVVVDRRHTSLRKKNKFFNIPILRGVVNFVESMIMSFGVLELSAEIMGEVEAEETKFEKWLKKTFGKSVFDIIMFVAGALGLALAVLLFTYLPNQVALWTERLLRVDLGIWKAALCGVLRILIFILYIVLVSLMKDIRRTFEYHGAEHKTIACYEAGEELTPENARKHSRFHPRCGTSFLFVMLLLSVVVSLAVRFVCEHLIGWDFSAILLGGKERDLTALVYTGLGLLTLPLVMGLGFEFLMFAGKHPGGFVRFLSAPGLWMQRLTTREPDDSQLEVAITALKCAMPEEFPDFDKAAYLIRDEYNNPPAKKGKKAADTPAPEAAGEEAPAPEETSHDA